MADNEAWSVLTEGDEEIKTLVTEVCTLKKDVAKVLSLVESIHQKLHQDSVRRRNKNLRQKVPFPFMPDRA